MKRRRRKSACVSHTGCCDFRNFTAPREREVQRAMNQKATTQRRTRDAHGGPPDDADIEWDQLVSLCNATGYGSDTEGGVTQGPAPMDIDRPEFPPAWITLAPAFPPGIDQSSGAGLLSVWNFLNAFPEVVGMVPCSLETLLGAAMRGTSSPLLARVHIALLRLLQADIEEAHAHGIVSVRQCHNHTAHCPTTHGCPIRARPLHQQQNAPLALPCWTTPGPGALTLTRGAHT